MPWDCLPEHIDEPHEWDGYDDDDHFYTRWRKKVKGWFAVGNAANRSKYWWANWREIPKCLLGLRGGGLYRLENSDGSESYQSDATTIVFKNISAHNYSKYWPKWNNALYLSRVQYWCKWHVALQWPLFLHGHYKDWQAYIGFKRDADKVYWLSLYLGKVWK